MYSCVCVHPSQDGERVRVRVLARVALGSLLAKIDDALRLGVSDGGTCNRNTKKHHPVFEGGAYHCSQGALGE